MKTKMLILPLLFKTKDLLSTLILIYFIILKEKEIVERGQMKEIIGVIISRKKGNTRDRCWKLHVKPSNISH